MLSSKGSRPDDDDEEWVEQKAKPKKARKSKTAVTSPAVKTFQDVDPQHQCVFLLRVPTVVRIMLLTRHLGFRDCLCFSRSCKMTYLDMVSNPLFIRYYVRALLGRHNVLSPRDGTPDFAKLRTLKSLVPFAGVAEVSLLYVHDSHHSPVAHEFLTRPAYTAQRHSLVSCVEHMDDAKRAIDTPGFVLPAAAADANVCWPAHLSTILMTWATRGDCLSSWSARANQVLFFLLHTFDLAGSVFEHYFEDPRYRAYYRNTAFCLKSPVMDFWLLLDNLVMGRDAWWSTLPSYRFLPFSSYISDSARRTSNRIYTLTAFRSMYHIHEQLARDLYADWMQPLVVPSIRDFCGFVFESGVVQVLRTTVQVVRVVNGHRKCVAMSLRNHQRERMLSFELHLDPVGLPVLYGVQDYGTHDGLFYPRRALFLEWRNEVEVAMRASK